VVHRVEPVGPVQREQANVRLRTVELNRAHCPSPVCMRSRQA
jgi:hypothetical protein